MRRTLISLILTVIAVAMASAVSADSAVSVGGGITLTESAAGVSMGTRIDACRKIAVRNEERGRHEFTYRPIAAWFSSSGMMPFLVMSKAPKRPIYRAAADFNNVDNIVKIELTPDHGLTVWEATNMALKGYQVEIPFLEPGGYGFEWKVTSRDKHNRLTIIFIPVSWSSSRTNSVVQQIMVQSAPEACWDFSDEQWVSMLSPAFQPTAALPDPGYLAKRNAQQQTLSQMTTQSASPVFQSQPSAPLSETPSPPQVDAHKVVNFNGEVTLVLEEGSKKYEFPITFNADIAEGDRMVFRRNGKFVAEAEITDLMAGRYIGARIIRGGGVKPHDDIFTKGVK